MNTPTSSTASSSIPRRDFLRTSTAALGGSILANLAISRTVHAGAADETIKIALIGCGGRGSGAANQALSTEGPVRLVAVADIDENAAKLALKNLQAQHPTKIDVPEERQFIGLDAYKQAIAAADLVILTTPPGFRAMQFEEAVRQGKHIFAEKPVCVDPAGFHRFMAAAQEAKKKNLKVGIGLQRRHSASYLETLRRLHDGQIGDIVSMRAYWTGNPPWVHARAEMEAQLGRKLSEMEYQLRNWYHFVWLSGDQIVEQHVHNIDVINWLKHGPPVKARGMGGCDAGKVADYGEIFNHFAVEFTYADGSICHSMSRQQLGCWNEVSEFAIGTKGQSQLDRHWISGPNAWRFEGTVKNPYQQEHDDLFDAVRNNKPYNEAEYGAISSFTGVLGRMAAYSGKEITWEQAVNSQLDSMVKQIDQLPFAEALKLEPPTKPGPDGRYALPIPGETVVI